mmetsp:Transcript_31831/g.51508  ORF Transcript_31831/g.51508 Transcript_31831/m.51508 type:complete len:255 (+) Transcript_31831:71-835(+)
MAEQKQAEKFTALVTGANRGIGLEYVKQFLQRDGYSVVACCRNPDSAKDLKELQEKNKGRVTILKLEYVNDEDVANVAKALKDKPIDLLVLNAGIMGETTADSHPVNKIFTFRMIGNLTRDDFLNVYNVNVVGPMLLVQALYDNVKASTRKQIVAVTSGAGSISDCGSNSATAYRCSKAALNMAFQNIAKRSEKDKDDVHALLLNPGWVQTGLGGKHATKTPEESVTQQMTIVDDYKNKTNGGFYNYNGNVFPW